MARRTACSTYLPSGLNYLPRIAVWDVIDGMGEGAGEDMRQLGYVPGPEIPPHLVLKFLQCRRPGGNVELPLEVAAHLLLCLSKYRRISPSRRA